MSHTHATDGGLDGYLRAASTYQLRLHLDNAHDIQTSGWTRERLAQLHATSHTTPCGHGHACCEAGAAWHVHTAPPDRCADCLRLGGLQAAADLIGEKLAEAPAAVVESIVGDQSLYLTDANGTVYLAEPIDSSPYPVPLYRLTVEAPAPADEPPVIDLMEALEKSLAAAKATVARGES